MKHIKVKSVSQLKELISNGRNEYFITLNYGLISRKKVSLAKNGKFLVHNYIDGTAQRLTEKELFSYSNIGESIKKGAFIAE
jgi:hypothetical protein